MLSRGLSRPPWLWVVVPYHGAPAPLLQTQFRFE